ncbi:5765_t:CDS:1, partial [Gigaspora rosea]
EDINKDNYITEEEIEKVVIETNQVLPLVQSNKRKGNNNKE